MKLTSMAKKRMSGPVASCPAVSRRALVRSSSVTRESVRSLWCDLSVAGIHGEHRCCTVLQHAVGKASGGSAYVRARHAAKRDLPGRQSASSLRPPRLT